MGMLVITTDIIKQKFGQNVDTIKDHVVQPVNLQFWRNLIVQTAKPY